MRTLLTIAILTGIASAGTHILIPMDLAQPDHLRAYGVAYGVLEGGVEVEWLLNYRGGSFLAPSSPEIEEICQLLGVAYAAIGDGEVAQIYGIMEESNMNPLLLEKAPKVAVYIPPTAEPWDDAVTLALEYAQIPYERVWDEDVIEGELNGVDWLHLHHEDFTGQYGKFYASYRNADWYLAAETADQATCARLGYAKTPLLKLDVARTVRDFVRKGGFLFAMCSAPITLDIALAAEGTDIVDAVYDGDGVTPGAQSRLDFKRTLAFMDFQLEMNPLVYEHSDVDATFEAVRRGKNTYFTLFDFSAKYDPVPTLLTQCHTSLVAEFLGQDTGFKRDRIKDRVIVLAEVKGTDEAKYIYGNYGKGFFSYLGGHDPEDYQHFVGDPPTRLDLHRNSPGYRLILNNILFPAAQKQKLKT
jgi:hypothetical protein